MHCQAFHTLPSKSSFSSLVTSLAYFSPTIVWAWILALDFFSAFLLSHSQPHLYVCIPFILCQKVHVVFCLLLNEFVQNLFDVVASHLFLLFFQWCFILPFLGETLGIGKLGHTFHGFCPRIGKYFK
jgi:hypothetical protein